MRVLKDKTQNKWVREEAERIVKHWEPEWGVMFLTSTGQEACREMGRHHGFNSLESAKQWVKDNTYRADPIITGFYVFVW